MKITICWSIAFYREMLVIRKELELLWHEIEMPPNEIKGENWEMITIEQYYELRKGKVGEKSWIWERKAEAIRMHFEKIEWADAVLVLNYEKNGIAGYVGANTLVEMGLAFHLRKPIYLYGEIPDIAYREEILWMRPILVNGNCSEITA